MKIFFFTKHELTWGSSRNRVNVYLRYITERGHTYQTAYCIPNSLSKNWIGARGANRLFDSAYSFWHGRIMKNLKLIWLITQAKKFDLIFIQKLTLFVPFVRLLRWRNKNVYFDFDDMCFWDLNSAAIGRIGIKKRLFFLRRGLQHPGVLALYRVIIAGNQYLANIASSVRQAGSIKIIPSPIDCELYHPFIRVKAQGLASNALPVIGWSGTGENHLQHLELLVAPLKAVARQYDYIFKLVGAMRSKKIKDMFSFLGVRFVCLDWVNPQMLPEVIRGFDIGTMPLADTEAARGKCGFKALEYMASGVAAIVSPVGINKEIIADGVNGFLAAGEEEWAQKLMLLISDKTLRDKFAIKGREAVEKSYSLEKSCKMLIGLIEQCQSAS